jgi:hypothetical protein
MGRSSCRKCSGAALTSRKAASVTSQVRQRRADVAQGGQRGASKAPAASRRCAWGKRRVASATAPVTLREVEGARADVAQGALIVSQVLRRRADLAQGGKCGFAVVTAARQCAHGGVSQVRQRPGRLCARWSAWCLKGASGEPTLRVGQASCRKCDSAGDLARGGKGRGLMSRMGVVSQVRQRGADVVHRAWCRRCDSGGVDVVRRARAVSQVRQRPADVV